GGSLTRNMSENGGRGAAIHCAVIDSGQHDDGGDRRGRKSRGKKERDGRCGAQARKNSYQSSDEHSDKTVEKIHRLQRNPKPIKKPLKDFHTQKPKGPAGS